ncbi:hypothetical protein THASP1DRAFT_30463 [Thamnocephalis sphaerospora]|uniref:RRM domain-containing protein n=1 Tax=Thamnocephalis sphaerospora TaxID=78915 RepID=A0A4P9XQF4_9FUNG|nr:hypothetical protein THASP1DRAFT_30463 [Thamnocephalis sphaerospora]|eukprot:RKP07721.1 hypothetical protein THASP1DRAFT_30463 [Thamnocephalis sphaerospora]
MPPTAAPNQALYVANLNHRVKKEEMKRSLHMLFTAYGRIVDIVHTRTDKMRSKAFVIFRDIPEATAALRGLNGFLFYERPLVVEYASTKAHAIALLDGTYSVNARGSAAADGKRARPADRDDSDSDDEMEVEQPPARRARSDGSEDEDMSEASDGENDAQPPHKILFVRGIAANTAQNELAELFQKYDGFKEVRMISGDRAMAFVEYGTAAQAGVAKEVMHGLRQTSGRSLRVTFAKR